MSLLLFILVITSILQLANCKSGFGFHVDPDTSGSHTFNQEQRRQIAHELFNILGIPDNSPIPSRPKGADSSSQVKSSDEKFLIEISEKDQHKSSEFKFNQEELNAYDKCDSIMTFNANNLIVPSDKQNHGKELLFDLSDLPDNKYALIMANFRIYRNLTKAHAKGHKDGFIIKAYRLGDDKRRNPEFIASATITANYQGWITLQITRAVERWMRTPLSNIGIYLAVINLNSQDKMLPFEDVGLTLFSDGIDKQPFVTAYFKYLATEKSQTSDINLKPDFYKIQFIPKKVKKNKGPSISEFNETCQRRKLYVDFDDFDWDNPIIAPRGFDAYYCYGSCSFPINPKVNATFHAHLQSYVHLLEPEKILEPCCVPTELESLDVIYANGKNINVTKYENIIVKSCGCR